MKSSILYLFSILLISACYVPNQTVWQNGSSSNTASSKNYRQGSQSGMPSKPGACYAKSLMPDITEKKLIASVPVYTGTNPTPEFEIKEVEYTVSHAGTKWIKKKADGNCASPNPEDCLVWCLIEIPEEKVSYKIVVDTTLTDQWKMENVNEKTLVESGGYTEWTEVVCDSKVSNELINNVQKILADQGFLKANQSGSFDSETKKALTEFQRQYELPLGTLNLQTLDYMDISY